MRNIWLVMGHVAALGGLGCVEQSTALSPAQREELKQYVSTRVPKPAHVLDAELENKVRLLGYDLEPAEARPGQAVTVTWYWKAERPLEDGWLLFTHVADDGGRNRLNQDGEGVVRRMYQPGHWKAGEYIKDVQRVTIPSDWNSPHATFYLGIFRGPHRLEVKRGPSDGENRVRALAIPVASARAAAAAPPAAPALPALNAMKVTAAPTIDGRIDEEAWGRAARTDRFVNTMDGERADPESYVRALWDDASLYLAFEVRDDHLKSTFANDDDHLWEQDAVEIMVDPDGDGRNYFEMQVSPAGKVFDTRYDSRRVPQPFGHVDWSSGLRARVVARGTLNDASPDEAYTVELAIPWTAFAAGEPPAARPIVGATWRINFYVMDTREQGERAVGWSPPRVGDFHVPARFGRLTFVDPAAPALQGLPGEGSGASAGTSTEAPPAVLPKLSPRLIEGVRQQLLRETVPMRNLSRAQQRDRPVPGEQMPGHP